MTSSRHGDNNENAAKLCQISAAGSAVSLQWERLIATKLVTNKANQRRHEQLLPRLFDHATAAQTAWEANEEGESVAENDTNWTGGGRFGTRRDGKGGGWQSANATPASLHFCRYLD